MLRSAYIISLNCPWCSALFSVLSLNMPLFFPRTSHQSLLLRKAVVLQYICLFSKRKHLSLLSSSNRPFFSFFRRFLSSPLCHLEESCKSQSRLLWHDAYQSVCDCSALRALSSLAPPLITAHRFVFVPSKGHAACCVSLLTHTHMHTHWALPHLNQESVVPCSHYRFYLKPDAAFSYILLTQ